MTLESKYDLDQNVWFMNDNRTVEGTITKVTCSVGKHMKYDDMYTVQFKTPYPGPNEPLYRNEVVFEYDLFPSKEELLKSL